RVQRVGADRRGDRARGAVAGLQIAVVSGEGKILRVHVRDNIRDADLGLVVGVGQIAPESDCICASVIVIVALVVVALAVVTLTVALIIALIIARLREHVKRYSSGYRDHGDGQQNKLSEPPISKLHERVSLKSGFW